jgi:Uma2 family endonuclease
MITAEVTFPREKLLNLKYPVEYVELDWDTYLDLSEDLGESTSLHLTFYRGDLIIVPVTELHEMLMSLLDRFVALAGLHLRINVIPTGRATLRSESKLIGVEPDLSYFVGNAGRHQVKNYVENEIQLPPDIVVEIDLFHSSEDKFAIYSQLGISEFWRFLDGKLTMFSLKGGRYAEVEKSDQLPILTSAILTDFLSRIETDEQFIVLSDFQNWLRNCK